MVNFDVDPVSSQGHPYGLYYPTILTISFSGATTGKWSLQVTMITFTTLRTYKEWKKELGCKIYAYCLMTNHLHLVVDPGKEAENLALLMKRVSGLQTRYVNKTEGRKGTLWEGRYKSSPIKASEYLLACCRYVELNPVRARIAADPVKYKWSSYRYKVGIDQFNWFDLDPCYISLGSTQREREKRYEEWVNGSILVGEWEMIRQAVRRGQLTGGNRFIEEVAGKLGRRVEFRGQGRPRSNK